MTLSTVIADVLATVPSEAEQRDELVKILQAIPQIKTVFGRVPDVLEPNELPAAILYVGAISYVQNHESHLRVIQDYEVDVYAAKFGQMREFEVEKAAEPFVLILPIAFAAYPRVVLTDERVFGLILGTGTPIRQMAFPYDGIDVYSNCAVKFQTIIDTTVQRLSR